MRSWAPRANTIRTVGRCATGIRAARGRSVRGGGAGPRGHRGGEGPLGGRRVPVERPRARAVDGAGEVELRTYRHFAERDALAPVVVERMLAGGSARRPPPR